MQESLLLLWVVLWSDLEIKSDIINQIKWRAQMKIILFASFIILGISFSACSTHSDDNYYDRANKASEKSLNNLDKE